MAFDVNGEESNSHGNGLNHVILVHTKNDVIFSKALYMLGLKKMLVDLKKIANFWTNFSREQERWKKATARGIFSINL